MKKYYLADMLTVCKFVLTIALCGMIFAKIPADIAIWVFIAAELCDAFDGVCARRWPYPNDGKSRWWRQPKVVQGAEHVGDIALLSVLAFFLFAQENAAIHWLTFIGGIAIAGFCIGVEVALQILGRYAPEKQRRRVIIIRRLVYLAGITIGIAELIVCTSWPLRLKIASCLIGAEIGIALIFYKWDRFTETHETFRNFLRRSGRQ